MAKQILITKSKIIFTDAETGKVKVARFSDAVLTQLSENELAELIKCAESNPTGGGRFTDLE